MYTKVGASPAHVLSQLSTAIVGAACFVASVFAGGAALNSAKTALFRPALVVSASDFSWAGTTKFRFDHDRKFAPSVATPDLDRLVPENVEAGLAKIARLEKTARHQRRQLLVGHFRIRLARARPMRSDRLRLVAAAPTVVVRTEAQRLQEVHQLLKEHLFMAMRELPSANLTTQLAKAPKPIEPIMTTHALAPRKIHIAVATRRARISMPLKKQVMVRAAPLARHQQDQRDSIVSTQAAAKVAPPAVSSEAAFNRLVDQAAGYQNFAIPPQAQEVRPITVAETDTETAPQAVGPKAVTKIPTPPPIQTQRPPAQPVVAPASEAVNIQGQQWIFPKLLPAEYPIATSAKPTVTTQAPAQPSISAAPPRYVAMNTQPSPGRAAETARELPPRVSFVEAFEWNHRVPDAQAEILTREDPNQPYGQSHQGWRIVRASEHWPSVYWNESGEIPLLSKNTAKVLSLKTGASVQSGAGIVIAKVPAGWSLELSGRAEHPLIYSNGSLGVSSLDDGSGQFLSNDNPSEERFYIFMNVSPGEEILYLVRSGETGALALPVFGGMLSYADLSSIQRRSISGRVLDASGADASGMSGMQVQLVGSGQSTLTNPSGYFRIDDVVTFGSHPAFLDVNSNRGYRHRYKINPAKHGLPLFYMSEEQVHDWIGQLDGGISSDSGLVVGALPNIAAANESNQPLPAIRTLTEDPTLTPETYTLSPTGQLLVKTPVSSENSRILGVQVPEGPTLVELKDKENRVIWSDLIVVSPRVLSVIGPY